MHVRTLILGGGMSGLSCAYHLKENCLVLEKSDEPGGLSRSIHQDGFVFDHTGHLLHLRNAYTIKLIPELLGDNLISQERRAWIYSHGTYTRYPYQANLYGLPKRIIQDCLAGLVHAQLEKRGAPGAAMGPESLKSWVLRTFGNGFAKHFFFPYNEKLWTVKPDVLTAEWVAPFVPKPSIEEAVTGAFSDQTKKFGYNATFLYPKKGGIQALAWALAKSIPPLRLNTEVCGIDLTRREVRLASGERFTYSYLVNTLPLARFLQMTAALPAAIQEAASALRWSSVYNLNWGVNRANISDKHWIYFPEKKYAFYRVGFPMNFTPHMAPKGCSSMYVEIGHPPGRAPDPNTAYRKVLTGLRDCGLLRADDKIVTQKVLPIHVAYVTYDKNRTRSTQIILDYLKTLNVQSIGRFGGWKYSYMEEAILEGQAAAEYILGR